MRAAADPNNSRPRLSPCLSNTALAWGRGSFWKATRYCPICVPRYRLHVFILFFIVCYYCTLLSLLSHLCVQVCFTRYYPICVPHIVDTFLWYFYCLLLWYYGILIYPICVPRYGLHVIMYFLSCTIMVSLCIIVPPVCPNILNAFIFYLLLWYHCIYYVPWYYLQVDIPSRFCPAGVVDAQKKITNQILYTVRAVYAGVCASCT